MLNGVISIPNVALALINGLLIDRYGPARMALWSAAIGVLGAALTAVGNPYELMVAGRFIFGVSEGAIFIALIAGLAQWFPRSGIALATALVPEPGPCRLLCRGHLDGLGALVFTNAAGKRRFGWARALRSPALRQRRLTTGWTADTGTSSRRAAPGPTPPGAPPRQRAMPDRRAMPELRA